MKLLQGKLTYANVVSTLCLFLLIAGGSAFAASQLGKNTVGTKQLKKNAVTGPKVKPGSLQASDFASGQLPKGEQGPPGAPGAPGPQGAALGYAHVEHGALDVANSKGVIAIHEGVAGSGEVPYDKAICFDLSFEPKNISVTAEVGYSGSSTLPAEFVGGKLAPEGSSGPKSGCPVGYRDALVEAYDQDFTPPIGFFVLFN